MEERIRSLESQSIPTCDLLSKQKSHSGHQGGFSQSMNEGIDVCSKAATIPEHLLATSSTKALSTTVDIAESLNADSHGPHLDSLLQHIYHIFLA